MFEVALALKYQDPRQMLEEMDKDTLMYWIAFLNRKKREHKQQDYQLALLTKMVAEMFSGKNRPLDTYLISFKTQEEEIEEQQNANADFVDSLPYIKGCTVVETTYYDGE